MSDTKSVLKSPTIISNSIAGVTGAIIVAQALSTGGLSAVLMLDPQILAGAVMFVTSQFSTFRRLFSDNKKLHLKKK
jgi:hypothetical protein